MFVCLHSLDSQMYVCAYVLFTCFVKMKRRAVMKILMKSQTGAMAMMMKGLRVVLVLLMTASVHQVSPPKYNAVKSFT